MTCLYCDWEARTEEFGLCDLHMWRWKNKRPMDTVRANAKSWAAIEGNIGRDGYLTLYLKGRRVRAHRLVVEKHLGRRLQRHEIVHHINRDRLDNRIENLLVMSQRDHVRIHKPRKGHGTPRYNHPCVYCSQPVIAWGLCQLHYKRWKFRRPMEGQVA